jgi:hypothetical protein
MLTFDVRCTHSPDYSPIRESGYLLPSAGVSGGHLVADPGFTRWATAGGSAKPNARIDEVDPQPFPMKSILNPSLSE